MQQHIHVPHVHARLIVTSTTASCMYDEAYQVMNLTNPAYITCTVETTLGMTRCDQKAWLQFVTLVAPVKLLDVERKGTCRSFHISDAAMVYLHLVVACGYRSIAPGLLL